MATATVMMPVCLNLTGRIFEETHQVKVTCQGKTRTMTETLAFVANGTVIQVSEERTDRFDGLYRSIAIKISPRVTRFMIVGGERNMLLASRLKANDVVSFRGTWEVGAGQRILIVRDIITAKVAVK